MRGADDIVYGYRQSFSIGDFSEILVSVSAPAGHITLS